jgi:subtilisin family serine protease
VVPGEVVVDLAPQTAKLRASTLDNSAVAHDLVGRFIGPTTAVFAPTTGLVSSAAASRAIASLSDELSLCDDLLRSSDSGVVRCSPNYIYTASLVPNDSRYSEQIADALTPIRAPSAWDVRTDASNVVVGVVDSGVDYTHPDLAANMWVNSGEIAGNGIDDDGNGYIDDIHGVNAVSDNGDPDDDNFHGTHCAGTIGAVGNNGIGVTGIAWQTKIMALKFLDGTGSGSLANALQVLDYALDMKSRGVNLRLLNNSWGGGGYSSLLQDRINALKAAGVVFVAAAGNSGTDNDIEPFYPANFSGVVSVAATRKDDELANFSCYGPTTVDIGAPGVNILSTMPGGEYALLGGTSMATPHVVGALALLLGQVPSLTVDEAIARLLATADPVQSLEGVTQSGRRLNVDNLLRDSRPAAPNYLHCTYTLEQIPYAPPTAVSTAPRVVPDPHYPEGSPVRELVWLPFSFPFYNTSHDSVWVSLYGVVFFRQPQVAEHEDIVPTYNTHLTPPHSIAPLYNVNFYDPELTPTLAPEAPGVEGVRVRATPSRVDIEWLVSYQSFPEKVRIVLSLFPNGTIEQYTSVPTALIAQKLRQSSLVGMRGDGTGDAFTISHRGFPINMYLNQGFRYTKGDCVAPVGGPPPTPPPTPTPIPAETTISIADVQDVARMRSNGVFDLEVYSGATVRRDLSLALNGVTCSEKVQLMLENRTNRWRGKAPWFARQFRTVRVTIFAAKQTVKIFGQRVKSKQTHTAACRLLVKAFKSMRKKR